MRLELTDVVSADLEGLVPPHDETDLSSGGRGEDLDLSGSSLLPLGRGLVESEELGSPGKRYRREGRDVNKLSRMSCRTWRVLRGRGPAEEEEGRRVG